MRRTLCAQPPSGGCELKRLLVCLQGDLVDQPPSGGCELKLATNRQKPIRMQPAAFGRL